MQKMRNEWQGRQVLDCTGFEGQHKDPLASLTRPWGAIAGCVWWADLSFRKINWTAMWRMGKSWGRDRHRGYAQIQNLEVLSQDISSVGEEGVDAGSTMKLQSLDSSLASHPNFNSPIPCVVFCPVSTSPANWMLWEQMWLPCSLPQPQHREQCLAE